MLIDTVGFISRLPHLLIEAFKSTLEEAVSADILLLLVDASDPEAETKLQTSLELLKELGAENKPVITVYNKCDIAENSYLMPAARNTVKISALTGVGLNSLLQTISENYPEQTAVFSAVLPYKESALLSWLHDSALVMDEKFTEKGVYVKAKVGKDSLYKFIPYITEEDN